jgi:hypothetical protein
VLDRCCLVRYSWLRRRRVSLERGGVNGFIINGFMVGRGVGWDAALKGVAGENPAEREFWERYWEVLVFSRTSAWLT